MAFLPIRYLRLPDSTRGVETSSKYFTLPFDARAEEAVELTVDPLIVFLQDELDVTRYHKLKLMAIVGQLQEEITKCEKQEEVYRIQLSELKNNNR